MSDANRSLLAAVATAVAAAGAVMMVSTPAQAAPPCTEWHFPTGFTLNQSDGFQIQVPTSGSSVGPGHATYFMQGKEPSVGTPSGGVNGKQIDITIPWSNGSTGNFRGFINADGSSSGSSESTSGFRAQWTANKPMICADVVKTPESADPNQQAPAPAAPAPAPEKPAEPAPPPARQEPCLNPFNLPWLPPC